MARDYFQDITPPGEDPPRQPMREPEQRIQPPQSPPTEETQGSNDSEVQPVPIRIGGESDSVRGIRNIASSRPMRTSRPVVTDMRTPVSPPGRVRKGSRWWLWGGGSCCSRSCCGLAPTCFQANNRHGNAKITSRYLQRHRSVLCLPRSLGTFRRPHLHSPVVRL